MITPENTVVELGSILRERKVDEVHLLSFRRSCIVWFHGGKSPIQGTGQNLIDALNDALGKVGKS